MNTKNNRRRRDSIERIEKMVKESPETAEIIKDITANINIRYE